MPNTLIGKIALVPGRSRGLARDLGPRGITVNAIQPGPTEADLNSDEAIRARVRPGRLGRDSEVA
jgi:3-oxoacyl-[acyl-carrier protein] reductase